jgi:hypothetical protein
MMYRETEEECNRDYEQLVSNYSEAKDYLDKNNWPHRHQFMHAWTKQYFTLLCRTNGRSEVMNRVCTCYPHDQY